MGSLPGSLSAAAFSPALSGILIKTYISRIFTRYLGISFTGYLELLRLSSATQMIAGQGTLEQIAQASGFPSVDAMTLAFKRHWGVTPGEYRRTFGQRRNASAAMMAEMNVQH